MGQGSPQHRRAAAGGGDAGNDLDFNGRVLLGHLVHQGGHTIHPRVPGAHHRHTPARRRGLHRRPAPVHLPAHSGGQQLLIWKLVLNQINIGRIAHQQLAALQGRTGTARHIRPAAGTQAHHTHLHMSNLLATATVTPFFARLGTINLPPPKTAARSHTLSTPVTEATKADGVNSPSAWASAPAE